MITTFQELRALFAEWAAQNLAPTTHKEYERHFENFEKRYGDIPLSQLRALHLVTWGRTFHQVQALQRLFNWAVNVAELMERSPFCRVKRPALGQRKRIMDRKLLLRFQRAAAPDFRRYLLFLRETLCRPQEARAVAWEWLRWEGGPTDWAAALLSGNAFFALPDYKARRRRKDPNEPRLLPISARLGRQLLKLATKRRFLTGPVLLRKDRKPWTKEAVVQRMRRLRKQLGITRDAQGETVVAYTVRHTMATDAAAKGLDNALLSRLLGHTTIRTTQRYLHFQAHHLTEALKRLHQRPGPDAPGHAA